MVSLIFALTILVGGLMLVACTSKDDGESGGGEEAALSGVVKTGGSTSVEKVMTALIYQFQAENPEVTIDYEMNGSGDGIKGAIEGLYEIGHSSRELNTDGTEDGLDAKAYAIDGIAVAVNTENKATGLSSEQIKGIYTGKIKNWSEVGGADAPITVVTREEGSGTRDAFAEIIGIEDEEDPSTAIVKNATVCDSTGSVQTTVSQNPNAIGYLSFSDVDETKVSTLSFNDVAISEQSLSDGTYGLKREFYVMTKQGAELSAAASAFIDFIMGEEGQKLVAENSLLPIEGA
jgi:phosphate transport system substrate-binding protein